MFHHLRSAWLKNPVTKLYNINNSYSATFVVVFPSRNVSKHISGYIYSMASNIMIGTMIVSSKIKNKQERKYCMIC